MKYIITVDVGTMSLKTSIYDTKGLSIFESVKEYSALFLPEGLVEQNPQDWYDALNETMVPTGEFIRKNQLEIEAISVTSQRASVIPVNKDGKVLHNAMTWQDKRSQNIVKNLLEKMPLHDIYRITGLRANPYFSLPKMMWVKEQRPDIYQETYKFLGVQDYVVYLLTKEFKTDVSQAARTMLVDISTFKWSPVMLSLSGIDPNKLCELLPPGSVAGNLTDEFKKMLNLNGDVPVIMAGGDQQNAALALNILSEGKAEANTGTGSFVIAHSNKPVFDEKARVLCSASAMPGKWIIEAGIFNTGAIFRWYRNEFYASFGGNYNLMNQEIKASPLGANGVMLIPHFEGSAAPYWNPYAKGLFFNLSLGTKRGDMGRAIFEGIAMEIAEDLKLMENVAGKIDTVSVAGGVTRSEIFNQIQADVYNKSIVNYSNSEATSLGALMSACVTLGIYTDYEEAFERIVGYDSLKFEPILENHEKYVKWMVLKNDLYNAINNNGVYEKFVKKL